MTIMSTDEKPRLALIGTESLRGKELKDVLEKMPFPVHSIDFFDPEVEEDYSRLTRFRGEPHVVRAPSFKLLEGIDLVFLAADRTTNRKYGRWAAKQNIKAIDLGESFENSDSVPAIVSDVNQERELSREPMLVANPHPASILLSRLAQALNNEFGLTRAHAVVLQPVSAFGDSGIEELAGQSLDVLNCARIRRSVFKAQIAFNLLPQVETVDEEGWSPSERRISSQLDFILAGHSMPISLSLVQVPVFHAYSVMMHIVLEKEAEKEAVARLFRRRGRFRYVSTTRTASASPVASSGKDKILVSQIKRDPAVPTGFWLWAVADNLTCGSVLNAYELGRRMVVV